MEYKLNQRESLVQISSYEAEIFTELISTFLMKYHDLNNIHTKYSILILFLVNIFLTLKNYLVFLIK